MIKIQNNSDTVVIVLHEIYGINRHIQSVCNHYFNAGFDVICPNLISLETPYQYEQEEEAYHHFVKDIRFEAAASKVLDIAIRMRKQYQKVFLLGYSVGATIAWLCSDRKDICDGVIGYYGSRIRDYLQVEPKCPVLLIFPKEELAFNVNILVDRLRYRDFVETHILEGSHGFADSFSKNYYSESEEQARVLADNFINQNKRK